MTTIPARHPHLAIDGGADHRKSVFPPTEPAWTSACLLADSYQRWAA